MKPVRIGTAQTVSMQTGEVIKEEPGPVLLPPAPGKCQECAVAHDPGQPHNQQSLYYQMRFHAEHGRYPTWSDAMTHCSAEVRELWRRELVTLMKKKGLDVPADLADPPATAVRKRRRR